MRKVYFLLLLPLSILACKTAPPPAPALLTDPAAVEAALQKGGPDLAWAVFEALNQPLTGPGRKGWETNFRQTSTIFLPNGAQPTAWAPQTGPHNLDSIEQVDGLVLLDKWSQDVRYQLLMNKDAFNYVLSRGFYNMNGITAAAQAGQPADFPTTSWEMKTSWIWIGQDAAKLAELRPLYFVAEAFYQGVDQDGRPTDKQTGWAALTGMHIISKARPDWIWMTFENVHNSTYTQIALELPVSPDVQAANARHQAALRQKGSVFANYQLDGIQTTFTEPASAATPTLLANSNIESAFQSQSSCITCHSTSSFKPDGTRFNIVKPGPDVAYYTGTPPDTAAQGFTSMDFVWSLRRAQWQRNANTPNPAPSH
jgi:hypothetical protein